ncbi:MAG: 30S ribosomal protein S21 [Candidatus Paceibacterota bacterium]|jgi:ribosomal protein S21|nr:30S ribosomal protein S21 [Candidatus Paceibacterota bacterium]MDD4875384.1 30S ribosomal protein S21 [Candidatus Paceibacterota bacterium]
MSIEVKKQKQESSQSLIYRFNRAVQRSGVLVEVRKRKFTEKPKSKNLQKRAAVLREDKKKKFQELKKQGKLIKKSTKRRRR